MRICKHGMPADACRNTECDERRERIATAMLPDAARSVHAAMPVQTTDDSAHKAAIVALAYADALIAELDK